jgi:two-component system chemotaxis response regulator CheY
MAIMFGILYQKIPKILPVYAGLIEFTYSLRMKKLSVAPIDISNLTFLCIDDNQHMRRIVRHILAGFGARSFLQASDGNEGLELLEQQVIDFILCDWEMPVMNGEEFVKIVRRPEHMAGYTPIIMLTGHTTKHYVMKACGLGVHEVLCKPVTPRALYERIVINISKPRQFLRTQTYFGPIPRKNMIRELLGEEMADLTYQEQDVPAPVMKEKKASEETFFL